ncbi:killer cell lectin-like receptor subfamily F member 1 [Pelecanus crispus]|uniref:killer cell lectin-like receptor subfamily F member 1 n=1 Tax=Pelecanus crispus TaxID=36300 RepID=UPI003F5CFCAE
MSQEAAGGKPMSPEGKCKLCPKKWVAYGEKCYWLSKKSWVWNEGKKDCEVRRAQMLIIQDLEEMVMQKARAARSFWGVNHAGFISSVTEGTNHVWMGLHLPVSAQNWTWVDGAALDPLMFKVLANMDSGSCRVVKAKRINSETCQAEFKWICEREAIEM